MVYSFGCIERGVIFYSEPPAGGIWPGMPAADGHGAEHGIFRASAEGRSAFDSCRSDGRDACGGGGRRFPAAAGSGGSAYGDDSVGRTRRHGGFFNGKHLGDFCKRSAKRTDGSLYAGSPAAAHVPLSFGNGGTAHVLS